MIIANYPNDEVKSFGERVNCALFDASCQEGFAGLGGCKEFALDNFDIDLRPYIELYLKGEDDSLAITYAAMKTKELEINLQN